MSDELLLHCPHCGDGKSPKLYVNIEKGVFNCFRCGWFNGSIKKLYRYPSLINKISDLVSLSEMQAVYKFKPLEEQQYSIFDELNPVREVYFEDPQYAYLKQRGWTEEMIFSYRPMISLNPDYSNRVIIPVLDDANNILYFSARSLTESSHKYINCRLNKGVIFKSRVSESVFYKDSCVICEGIFDSAKVPNSIALLGKYIVREQEKELIHILRNKKNVYVCLDFGAECEMVKMATKLSSWFQHLNLYIINTENYLSAIENGKLADLGDLSKSLNSIQLMQWIVANSTKFVSESRLDFKLHAFLV